MATYTITEAEPSKAMELQFYPPSQVPSERKLGISDIEDIRQLAIPPAQAVEAKQRWKSPNNIKRVFAAFFSFFVFGMNDGSYGVSHPCLKK